MSKSLTLIVDIENVEAVQDCIDTLGLFLQRRRIVAPATTERSDGAEENEAPAPSVTEIETLAQTIVAPPPPSSDTAVTDAAPGTAVSEVAGVELDSEGLPWDGRINSPSRAKLKKDGTWKLIRGIDKEYAEQVKTELRAMMASNPVATAPTAPTPEPSPQEIFGSAQAAVPAPLVEDEAAAPMSFPALMQAITERTVAGTLSADQVNAALARKEIQSLPLLASRPDLIPAIAAELGIV